MADTDEKINECIEKSLNYLSAISRPIVLKCEQRISIQHLLLGKDVIAILPTGFGKSMIFTVYALAKVFVGVVLLAMTEKYKTIIKLNEFCKVQNPSVFCFTLVSST